MNGHEDESDDRDHGQDVGDDYSVRIKEIEKGFRGISSIRRVVFRNARGDEHRHDDGRDRSDDEKDEENTLRKSKQKQRPVGAGVVEAAAKNLGDGRFQAVFPERRTISGATIWTRDCSTNASLGSAY